MSAATVGTTALANGQVDELACLTRVVDDGAAEELLRDHTGDVVVLWQPEQIFQAVELEIGV